MNVARFIARRYFKANKSRNVIHLITNISVVGIAISTAALVILLSAFNGIEQIVISLYSDFDSDINIRATKSKTFNQNFVDIDKVAEIPGVSSISRVLEEIVILKNDEKWAYAEMLGVDSNFLEISKMDRHILDGVAALYINERPQAIFGATLLDKLDGYIPYSDETKQLITFNVPLRDGKIKHGSNPLNIKSVEVSARMNYNKEVNAEKIVVPYDLAKELLGYDEDLTAFYIDVDNRFNLEKVKKEIQNVIGPDFEVKTNFEKNELIFKTSKSERLIVYFILVFVFLLASFNLIASITMLFVEKKEDVATLFSLGMHRETVFNIFFYKGLLIVLKGVIFGLLIGYGVVFLQIYFGLIKMPNFPGGSFPIQATFFDAIAIVLSVSVLGFLIVYFPTKFLVSRHPSLQR